MAIAQKPGAADTANRIEILIRNATNYFGIKTDTAQLMKLIGDVHISQGTSEMYCDSAYINQDKNNVEAFGNVRIIQPGTQVQSDYLRYIGNQKLAYLRDNVQLTDGHSTLNSQDLTYNLGTKVANYSNGGTLQTDATTVSSNEGVYNTVSKDARFKGDVLVTDPQYTVTSDDLGWNTESKVAKFNSPSVVTNDKSTLHTNGGMYDTKHEVAHFTNRSSIMNNDQYVEADKIDYDRTTGYGIAKGKVIAIDTSNHSTLWSEFAAYNEKRSTLLATGKPVLRQENGKDSLFIRADTFYSAPEYQLHLKNQKLKAGNEKQSGKMKKQVMDSMALTQTRNSEDTTSRYYTGYRNVRIFSDSLQGRCDSISYSYKDSVMKMIKDPVTWARRFQMTGDTIILYLDTAKSVRRLLIPGNALLVSQSGPDKAQLFDQVQGKTLNAYFIKNAITHMVVWPAAENIYFPTDESGAYLGVDQSQSERMTIFFRKEQIKKILWEQEAKHQMIPLEQADLPAMRLSRFQWLQERRPKSKAELFE